MERGGNELRRLRGFKKERKGNHRGRKEREKKRGKDNGKEGSGNEEEREGSGGVNEVEYKRKGRAGVEAKRGGEVQRRGWKSAQRR